MTWTDSGGLLTISGVALIDGLFPVTIKVPDTCGHVVWPSDTVITDFALAPLGGWAQVQVAS